MRFLLWYNCLKTGGASVNKRLTNKEIRLLEYLNSQRGYFDSNLSLTTIEGLSIKLGASKLDMKGYLVHLLELGYIKEEETFKEETKYYMLTQEGQNYLEFRETDEQDRYKWSVKIPIAVAVITTLIVNLITYLFQK